MSEFRLPDSVITVIDRLNEHGFEAYAVGGCVRNFLLGKEPKDYDVTTSAKPDEILSVFEGIKTAETGIKYGTVTVIPDGMPIEVTTYRIDGDYGDNRRPDSVSFTTKLAEDLKRRDFTVNALAYNPRTGIVDIFGGREDLKNGILRAIGASKHDVSSMFNAETIIIGFTSGLLGVVVTYLLTIPINIIIHKLTELNNLSAYLPITAAIILIAISVLLTLIAGVIPSRSAAKKDPVVALRTE